jgi:hypothetical protein
MGTPAAAAVGVAGRRSPRVHPRLARRGGHLPRAPRIGRLPVEPGRPAGADRGRSWVDAHADLVRRVAEPGRVRAGRAVRCGAARARRCAPHGGRGAAAHRRQLLDDHGRDSALAALGPVGRGHRCRHRLGRPGVRCDASGRLETVAFFLPLNVSTRAPRSLCAGAKPGEYGEDTPVIARSGGQT